MALVDAILQKYGMLVDYATLLFTWYLYQLNR